MLCNHLQNVVATTYIFRLQLSTFIFYNKQGQLLGEAKGRAMGQAEGRKTERIEAIQNMISLGLTKEKILTVYSEKEYNEAIKAILVEA